MMVGTIFLDASRETSTNCRWQCHLGQRGLLPRRALLREGFARSFQGPKMRADWGASLRRGRRAARAPLARHWHDPPQRSPRVPLVLVVSRVFDGHSFRQPRTQVPIEAAFHFLDEGVEITGLTVDVSAPPAILTRDFPGRRAAERWRVDPGESLCPPGRRPADRAVV
jgi:hypothetical protein